MTIVVLMLVVVGAYLALGALFAAAFVTRGVSVVDPVAAHAGWGFRILILPASMALWPLLLMKWRFAAGKRGEGP